MLLDLLDKLNEMLPAGPANLMDLMGNHESEFDEFASDKLGALMLEIVKKFSENFSMDDKLPQEIMRFCGITDSPVFVLETMRVLSESKNLEKAPHFITKVLEELLNDENYLTVSFVRLSTATLANDYDAYIHQLINLPEKIANRLQSKFPDVFHLRTFNAVIMTNALKAFYITCRINEAEQSAIYEMRFLSQLMSKCFVNFKNEYETLEESMQVLSMLSLKYNDNVKKLIVNLQRQSTEIAANILFGRVNDKRRVISTIGGGVWKTSCDWKFTMLKKIPFLSTYENDKIIENLTFFLVHEDEKIMVDLLLDLLKIWSTKSHVNDVSFEQHQYVTKFIVLMVKYLSQPGEHSENIKRVLFSGVQHHLESSDERLKVLGMITSETVLSILDSNLKDDEKLKFDYSSYNQNLKKIVQEIREFPEHFQETLENVECDADEIDTFMERLERRARNGDEVAKLNSSMPDNPHKSVQNKTDLPQTVKPVPPPELDSDDEFETYNDPDDLPVRSDTKRPRYLLDIIQAFSSKENLEDVEKFELSMKFSPDVIAQQLPSHHFDIATDLLAIFLNLDKSCYMENFDELRMKNLVEICSAYPKECANYLCTEFNTETSKYSMSRRAMMLNVLSETAKKLSQLEMPKVDESTDDNSIKHPTNNKLMIRLNQELENRNKADAQKIIRRRLIAKTRRIATKTKTPVGGINKFSEVAGWFFFPLVHGFGRKQIVFKSGTMLNHNFDTFLLVKFLHAISVIMLCAENSTVSPKMAKEIMNLSLFLRYHNESKIRLAVLHMVSTVILAVPKAVLQREFSTEINEFINHLSLIVKSGVVSYEIDKECREFAQQLIGMFVEVVRADDGN